MMISKTLPFAPRNTLTFQQRHAQIGGNRLANSRDKQAWSSMQSVLQSSTVPGTMSNSIITG